MMLSDVCLSHTSGRSQERHYIIYMDDTIIYATAQSEPLPVDHEYSWRKVRWVPQA